MRPHDLLAQSLTLLYRVLDEACQRLVDAEVRTAFIYRHARNIYDLADDLLALEIQGRTSTARIVVRPMLESLFRLVAAVKRPSFAAERLVGEIDDEVERIERWIKTEYSTDFQKEMAETLSLLSATAALHRPQSNEEPRRRWNVYDTAQLAELNWIYARDYFIFSKYVHCDISGIICQESQTGRGHVLQTAISVVLSAAGYAVQGIETVTPQAHIDEAARLLQITNDLLDAGAFYDDDA